MIHRWACPSCGAAYEIDDEPKGDEATHPALVKATIAEGHAIAADGCGECGCAVHYTVEPPRPAP